MTKGMKILIAITGVLATACIALGITLFVSTMNHKETTPVVSGQLLSFNGNIKNKMLYKAGIIPALFFTFQSFYFPISYMRRNRYNCLYCCTSVRNTYHWDLLC